RRVGGAGADRTQFMTVDSRDKGLLRWNAERTRSMQILYERDARPELLRGKQIAMLGYGSQGHAQAQNLLDSGYSVVVGLAPGRNSAKQAATDGFKVMPVPEAVCGADFVQILAPDEHHRSL